jgi:hypothetical protein
VNFLEYWEHDGKDERIWDWITDLELNKDTISSYAQKEFHLVNPYIKIAIYSIFSSKINDLLISMVCSTEIFDRELFKLPNYLEPV